MTDVRTRSSHPGGDVRGERYEQVRGLTDLLAAPLSPEDQTVQSMPDTSPTKWHRAHTTWFFEEFLLASTPGYRRFDPAYAYLFNSYYEAVGARHPRAERGLLSRPGVAEVDRYRRAIDEAMLDVLSKDLRPEAVELVTLGLHHEQQHQELLLMDIKHVLSRNPLLPAYSELTIPDAAEQAPLGWLSHGGGLVDVGFGGEGFAFDNELPRHVEYLPPFRLANRAVTSAEWREFIDDDGYNRPELWLSDGWAAVQAGGWKGPLYWERRDGEWHVFTLGGLRPLGDAEPVCHVSYYEADAYARWAGARLPTEAEWEVIAVEHARPEERTLDLGVLHPRPAAGDEMGQLVGDVWEWTASPYTAYAGFRPVAGAVGEYNGKFMVNQQVLRGGCCVSPRGHVRVTYRNFFPPGARWGFSGVRLARDAA